MEKYNLLIIEQEQEYTEAISNICCKSKFNIYVHTHFSSAMERLKEGNIDIVIFGLSKDDEGLELLNQLHDSFPDIPIIVLGQKSDPNNAIRLLEQGADYYLNKRFFRENEKIFAYECLLAIERACITLYKNRLANFAELNIHPIIELNTTGSIVYLNPVAATQFPDLKNVGLQHPLLDGLKKLILDLLPNQHSEMVIFNREITLGDRCYDQQIFVLPNSGVYIYIVDITERNKLRSQALLSDRLATVGTLAAGVAHEINNPISWVLENLRYLKTNMEELKDFVNTILQIAHDDNAEKVKRNLQILAGGTKTPEKIHSLEEIIAETLQGAERIRDIVRDLKGFARDDKSEITPVDVNTLLETAISMAVPEFKYRARLEKHLATHLPPVLITSGKLHQVFLNLIVNAAQAIPEGNIEKNRISIWTRLEGERIRIDFSDTGHGIPNEDFPKLFDPFFTTKPAGKGTGLGLAITHEVISKFGGEIKVKSQVNKGTTFTVFLPAHPEYTGIMFPKEESLVATKSAKKRVLIVDDEISLLKTMQRMLQGHHEVTSALGGQAAMDILIKNPNAFDVIVCDLNMPNISGVDLYRFVAKNYRGLEQAFIFITAGVYSPLMTSFLETISNPIVEKPFTPKALLNAIDNIPAATKINMN